MARFTVLHHRQMLLLKSSELVCRAWASAHANCLLIFALSNWSEHARSSLNSPWPGWRSSWKSMVEVLLLCAFCDCRHNILLALRALLSMRRKGLLISTQVIRSLWLGCLGLWDVVEASSSGLFLSSLSSDLFSSGTPQLVFLSLQLSLKYLLLLLLPLTFS